MKKTKIFKRVTAAIMCALLIGSSFIMNPDTSNSLGLSITADAAISTSTNLKVGNRGTQVSYLQMDLNVLAYNAGKADGVFGNSTKNAVIRFQKAYGLTADGIAGKSTINKLNSVAMQLQNDLNYLGFSCGTVDGILGSKSVNAIKAFQKKYGLTVDGIAGSKTLSKIKSVKNGAVSNGANTGANVATSYSTPLTNGSTYYISPACATGSVIDVAGVDKSDGANVWLWKKSNGSNQQWKAIYLGNGYYKFKAVHSGKCLDVSGGQKTSGTNVQQWYDNGCDAQEWMLKSAGNGYYYVMSRCNGLYLDISGGESADKSNVQVYTGNKSNAQKFKFTKISTNNSYTNKKLNLSAFINYANKYWNQRNPSYNYYQNNNCCNFASQCLVAAGMPTNSTFMNGTSAFIRIPEFKKYIMNTYKVKYYSKPSASNISVGDVIMTDNGNHVMVVVKKSGNTIYANGNTNNRKELVISTSLISGVLKTSTLFA